MSQLDSWVRFFAMDLTSLHLGAGQHVHILTAKRPVLFKTVSRCRHVYDIITNALTPHAMILTAQYIHAHPSYAMRMLCQAVQCMYMAVSVS